ncbi:MAG: tRNA epoxyqueuosine(34) reductase QueG [Fuerstiella sp.]
MNSDVESLTDQIRQAGRELGFDLLGIAPAVQPPGYHPLLEWLAAGYDADMSWIGRRVDAYRHPDGVLPGTRSVIVVALNYHADESGPRSSDDRTAAAPRIASYASGTVDYHDVLKNRLKQLGRTLRELMPAEHSRAVVDTAPLLERDFARLAGIGWFGKNTMLISRKIGSWFFLGALLTSATLVYDQPFEGEFCGTCQACLDVCPTDAFPAPHVLDANRCISYLTIERRQLPIADDLKAGLQDWIFGCDLCQEVCPWNRFAPDTQEEVFQPVQTGRSFEQLLELDESAFRGQFRGTPLERTGRDAIVRNTAIAAANAGRADLLPQLNQLTTDSSELVRDAARWAVQQLANS